MSSFILKVTLLFESLAKTMVDSKKEWRIERLQWYFLSGLEYNQEHSSVHWEIPGKVPLIIGKGIDGLEILERRNPIYWK